MAEKLALTMMSLAEENRDLKTSLRLMLKYEIQSLLDRLSDLGEESLLLLANTNEGTSGHLGTQKANNFLATCNSNNVNLKDTFLKFCSGTNLNQTPDTARIPVLLTEVNGTDCTTVVFPQAPAGMANLNSLTALINSMNQSPGCIPSLLDGLDLLPSAAMARSSRMYGNMGMGHNMANQGEMYLTGEQQGRKKHACRHFVGKGYCWHGNTCAFLHTRDPVILRSLLSSVATDDQKTEEPVSSSDQTDVVEETLDS